MHTKTLARYVAELGDDAMPAEVRARARDCFVDTLAVAGFGASLPWSRIVIDYARRTGPGGRSEIVGDGAATVQPPLAALANGALSHAFELDSLRKPGAGVHPGAILVSAVLAVAQDRNLSGRAALTAFIAGCEAMFRIGAAAGHSSEKLGFHAPGLTGTFGAAAAAGRLMGLSPGQMANAFGIAGSLCSGLLAFAKADGGGMVKRLHMGRAAEGGVMAAALAEAGFEGPTNILEGEFGFLSAYAVDPDSSKLTADLGERWETRLICMKSFPCHVTAHTPVVSMLALKAKHGIAPDEVESIVIAAGEKVQSHHAIFAPRDIASAQYSVPFCAALALARDPADPRSFLDGAVEDPLLGDLCQRTRIEDYPKAAEPGSAWASAVTVRLKDGREFSQATDDFRGSPTSPMTADALKTKFLLLSEAGGLSQAAAERLFDATYDIDRRVSMAGLCGASGGAA